MNSTRPRVEGVTWGRGAFHVRASLLRSHGSIGAAVGLLRGVAVWAFVDCADDAYTVVA